LYTSNFVDFIPADGVGGEQARVRIVEPCMGQREMPRFGTAKSAGAPQDPSILVQSLDMRMDTHGSRLCKQLYRNAMYTCYMYGVEQSYRGVSREIAVEGLEQAAILMVRHLADRTGLGLTANLTLGTLDREGPARVTALAAAASIRQPAMTELVQRLERQRLVSRVDDPGDGRAALVTITNAGRALLEDKRRDRRDRLAGLLTALPADDEATLILAMRVALPIIRQLIDDAQQVRTQTDSDTSISQSRS
jgi:DNA-binding MarR family transcriptional regulator